MSENISYTVDHTSMVLMLFIQVEFTPVEFTLDLISMELNMFPAVITPLDMLHHPMLDHPIFMPPVPISTKLLTFIKPHKLLTLLSVLVNKSLKVRAESNTFHSKRKLLNTEKKSELKEFQKPEKSLNIENKFTLRLFQEKSLKQIITLLNI